MQIEAFRKTLQEGCHAFLKAVVEKKTKARWPGLPYCKARGVKFGLGGPFNWARRSVQIEAFRKNLQEGYHAILKAVVEKKTKAK